MVERATIVPNLATTHLPTTLCPALLTDIDTFSLRGK
jgi:hypothetical protein